MPAPITDLPQFLRDLIGSPPRHGDGVHNWLYRVARQLHAHRSEADIHQLLAAAVSGCGRDVSESEITDAVSAAGKTAWQPKSQGTANKPTTKSPPQWPKGNTEQREAVIAEMDGFGLVDLWEASPCRWDDRAPHTNEIIKALFPPDCLLCAGTAKDRFATAPLGGWLAKDMSAYQFIVPSPMSALTGTNGKGEPSSRCLDNTCPRRFLVIEADHGTRDEQAAIIWYLATIAPLALVLFSGNKSLHAWFDCAGAPDEVLRAFFRRACLLGADSALWTPCQLVRMPDGLRPAPPDTFDGPRRQSVYFFNPPSINHEN